MNIEELDDKLVENTDTFSGTFHERDSHAENNIVDEVKDSFPFAINFLYNCIRKYTITTISGIQTISNIINYPHLLNYLLKSQSSLC